MFYFLIIFLTDKLDQKLHQIYLRENLASLKIQKLSGAEGDLGAQVPTSLLKSKGNLFRAESIEASLEYRF